MGLGLLKRLREAAGAGQDDIRDVVRSVCAALGRAALTPERRAGAAAALAETLEELSRRGVADRKTVEACGDDVRALREGKGA